MGLWVVAASLAVAVPSLAEPPPDLRDVASWLDQQVRLLDASDYASREEASRAISDATDLTIQHIERVLGDSGLSTEQRMRLMWAGYRRFASTDRAALGVSFAMFASDSPGVEITQTIEGFDSVNVIQTGDILLAFGGTPITSFDQARIQIVSFDPGEVVELRLLRQGEPVIAGVRLGSLSTLRGGSSASDDSLLRGAWSARLARARLLNTETITLEPGLSSQRWADLAAMVEYATMRKIITPRNTNANRLAMAGQATATRQMLVAPSRIVAGGESRGADYYAIADFALTAQQRTRVRSDFLQRQIDELRVQIKIRQSQLLAERLPDRIRAQLEQQIRDYRLKLEMLQAEQRKVGNGVVEP